MSAVVCESFLHVPYASATVMSNGCFDLLHVSHVRLLERAAMFGRRLVVAVNSDHSVKMLKGNERPLFPLKDRMEILACLDCVDVVTSFPDNNVVNVIRHIAPHCWIKGAGYTMESLDKLEVQAARDVGAAIVLLEKFGDYSTTGILERMGSAKEFFVHPNRVASAAVVPK